jgi:hypothetical protein
MEPRLTLPRKRFLICSRERPLGVEHAQCAVIPGAAKQGRELRPAAAHGVQHGGNFLGEHQETSIACLLSRQDGDEAARGKTRAGDTILRPGAIHLGEELGNLVPTGPLASLAGFSDQHDKEIQAVTGGPNHAVRAGADDVAKGGEQLQENGFRLGFGVRGQGAHGLPGETIERVSVEYGLPHGKPGQAGLLGCRRRFLTHSTSLRAGPERRLWLWLGFWREWSRVDGETAEAGLGEQLVPSPFYLCEGGQPGLS